MARTKTTPNPPPPKVHYKALYSWASNELLNECTTLTTVEDIEKHLGDLRLYNFNAFCRTHDSCTALVVGSDDVASCYSIGVLARRQVGRREGSRGAREAASY